MFNRHFMVVRNLCYISICGPSWVTTTDELYCTNLSINLFDCRNRLTLYYLFNCQNSSFELKSVYSWLHLWFFFSFFIPLILFCYLIKMSCFWVKLTGWFVVSTNKPYTPGWGTECAFGYWFITTVYDEDDVWLLFTCRSLIAYV